MQRFELASIRLYLRRTHQFFKLVLHNLNRDAVIQNSAALTYTTLLSLVPLMTVMLALFSVFPASEKVAVEIEGFIFQNFVPAAGEAVHGHLQNFSQKAARLSGVGFGFLVVVALLLMANIDKAFNTIWHVQRKRHPIGTFMVYWAILSLGPILIVISVAVTSYLVSIPLLNQAETVVELKTRLLSAMPVLISALAFTLLYTVVPNRSVSLKHALTGGVLAALLFEAAKRGFALYVTHFPTYEAIYGAMAVVPIFLIWIYLSWLVTLFGAEFTYCLGIFRDDWHEKQNQRGGEFLLALHLLKWLNGAQEEGRALATQELADLESGVPEEHAERMLDALHQARFVLKTEDKAWALARDLRTVKLIDLYRAVPLVLPDPGELKEESSTFKQVVENLYDGLETGMDRPLSELI